MYVNKISYVYIFNQKLAVSKNLYIYLTQTIKIYINLLKNRYFNEHKWCRCY